jgi:hypothetical protein
MKFTIITITVLLNILLWWWFYIVAPVDDPPFVITALATSIAVAALSVAYNLKNYFEYCEKPKAKK